MIEFEYDAHSQVCARMPAKDAPPSEWVAHYEWAAGVYGERGEGHHAEASRYRAELYRRQLEAVT